MTPVVVVDPDAGIATAVASLLSRDAGVDVRHADDLDAAWTVLVSSGVLVAGPSLAGKAGLAALRDVHRRAPAIRIVLAFDRKPGAPMREVVAVGAEALVDPSDAAELRAALDRAVRISREVVPIDEFDREPAAEGRIVAVVSATGGCGKTFLAASLATSLATWTDARIALVDLDLQFGEVAATLGLRPRTTFADLVGADLDELPAYLDDVLLPHSSGVSVLAAPLDPAQADAVDASLIAAVLSHLRATFDVVLVDTSTGLAEGTLAALDLTDETILVSLLDVASIRNLRTLDRTLDRLQVGERRFVLNKEGGDVGLTAEEVERVLNRSFVARIPFSQEVLRSTNTGRPMVVDGGEAAVVGPIADIALSVAPEGLRDLLAEHRPAAELPARRRWSWSGFGTGRTRARSATRSTLGSPPIAPIGTGWAGNDREPIDVEVTS